MKRPELYHLDDGKKEIYFAAGCFWGTEKLYEELPGVIDAQSGYANGDSDMIPDYQSVCRGNTGYRETVRVVYDPEIITLRQLLFAFFEIVDPTVWGRQGNDIGDQYQTGIYYKDEESRRIVEDFADSERQKYPVFAVEIEPLLNFFPAEEFHQDYLDKNPYGYCHIPRSLIAAMPEIIGALPDNDEKSLDDAIKANESENAVRANKSENAIRANKNEDMADGHANESMHGSEKRYEKPDDETLRKTLTPEEYEVTQHAATEYSFTGLYWDFFEPGIYVDITTGQPLFSSLDKYRSSCGWPAFTEPVDNKNVVYSRDSSYGMERTEVRSSIGGAHLGHVFQGDPESPNGVRYCINSASLRFIPEKDLEKEGYGEFKKLFEKNK